MIMDNLKDQLKNDIIEALNLVDITPDQLDETEPLLGGSLGLDSIDLLELVVMLKKKYNINVSNLKEAKDILHSIADIKKYIEENKKK